MPTSDPIQILLRHDQWATTQIIGACAKLAPEQFHQRFEMGPGSLHDTITHLLGAMRGWTEVLAEQPSGPRIDKDGQRRTPAELLSLLETYASDLAAQGNRLPLSEIVTRTREQKTYQFARGAILTHITTHGMHHRAQCLNMLRQLHVQPLPPSSVVEWTFMADTAPKA